MVVGYEFLRTSLALPVPPIVRPARVQPVTRISPGADGCLAIPPRAAPTGAAPLDHVLFAIRHEGIDLLLLSQALKRIPEADMLAAVAAAPNGQFVRKAGFLWEHFNGRELAGVAPGGQTVPLFDPARYFTVPGPRNARWRVNFNGLGSLDYCPVVRRTPEIEALLARDLLGEARRFADDIGPELLDRALDWAYLHETESSFDIEREAAPADKAAAFAALLRQAGESVALDEQRLVELQNAIVTNAWDHAAQYRTEQNWLRGPMRGAAGVTYVPPPPESVPGLMRELLALIETPGVDPLLLAALACFGFVFIHPFMDGNGRLSRFLVHHVLGRSGRLPRAFVLPVSVAMRRNEADYLRVLQAFSRPVRDLWRVTWIDEGEYRFEPLTGDALYRYWDATACVHFLLDMTRQALERDLRDETHFLVAWDGAWREVNERHDLRGNALATLMQGAFRQGGTVSANLRRKFAGQVPEAAFDAVEDAVKRALNPPAA
ncbi:Fic family protein [Derxia gummosa]|uniref:Fic family protein n=1 Tax=Derxia gummosa DSM 723 TaxID=1121388 RepID=A0A8B6X6S8_9BURK|nr:Fic family protein [Derxia gummosa]